MPTEHPDDETVSSTPSDATRTPEPDLDGEEEASPSDAPPPPEGIAALDLHWLSVPPPNGPPWDLSLEETPWVFIDCEMTGVNPARDALIEIAAVRMRGSIEEASLTTLLRSEVESSPEAFATHGIGPEALVHAPDFSEVADELAMLVEGAVPVLHGAAMDRAFLNHAFETHGVGLRLEQVVDTVHLSRRAVLAQSYKLSSIAKTLGVAPRTWHRAREDVHAILGVFQRVTELLRPVSARDLWQVRAGVRLPTMVRDSVREALERRDGRALALLVRQPGRSPRRVVGRVIRWESPHLTLGLGATGRHRGVAMLRADRILRVEPLP